MLVRPYWGSFWCYYGTQFHSTLPDSLTFTVFLTAFLQCSECLGTGIVLYKPTGTGIHNYVYPSLMVSFCCKVKFPSWGAKIALIRDKCLEFTEWLWWLFIKLLVVSSPPRWQVHRNIFIFFSKAHSIYSSIPSTCLRKSTVSYFNENTGIYLGKKLKKNYY